MDNFVDKLRGEGETIMSNTGKMPSLASNVLPPPVNVERYIIPVFEMSIFDSKPRFCISLYLAINVCVFTIDIIPVCDDKTSILTLMTPVYVCFPQCPHES